jgi:hypothetical protein
VVHQLRDGELLLAFQIRTLDLSVETNLFVLDSLLADGLLVAAVDAEPTGDGQVFKNLFDGQISGVSEFDFAHLSNIT